MLNNFTIQFDDELLEHRERIQTLTDAGITIPAKWNKLNQQLSDYLALESPTQTKLIDAVIGGTPAAELNTLRSLALAEQAASPQAVAAVTNAVVHAVLRKLLDIYQPVAADIYQKAADMFDRAASDFSAAAVVIAPETPAAEVVNGSEAERSAWTQATLHAQRLHALTPVLATAATLAGTPVTTDELLLPLCCDPGTVHRRKTWLAWAATEAGSRCGRWSALVALGIRIRACPLEQHTRYRECKPIEHRREPTSERGVYRNVTVDPEDNPDAVEPINPRRGQGKAMAV